MNGLYAVYAMAVFTILVPIAWLLVAILPRMNWRWASIRGLAKTLALATGINITVEGREQLPPSSQNCVYVANHASYIDSLAVVACIPRMFSFVVKKAFQNNFFTAVPLNRLGARFVERFDAEQSITDARALASEARQQKTLFFFPEGTFTRVTGLRGFRMGAFVTAVQAGMPVVPISIRGTRSILRGRHWMPQRGSITITVGEAISTDVSADSDGDQQWHAAVELRDRSREQILRHCGESDLS